MNQQKKHGIESYKNPNATTSFTEAKNFIPAILLCIGVIYTYFFIYGQTCTEKNRFIINLFAINQWSYACLYLTYVAKAVVYLTFEHALLHQMLSVCAP